MTTTRPQPGPRPWQSAWQDALYGPDGFYRGESPHAHFTTATSPGLVDVLAEAVVALARRDGLTTLVDVAAGGGELLGAVARRAPDLALVGVEVRPRPLTLPPNARWVTCAGGPELPEDLSARPGSLVLAHEWLDNVPCTIAERTPDGLREVQVRADGRERLGPAVVEADLAWAQAWWPAGSRVEIGRARDEAWAGLLARVPDGLVVAVDYGHTRDARPPAGTVAAYRRGVRSDPVLDGTHDVTAHVAVDSLLQDSRLTQVELFDQLGITAARPPLGLATRDPQGYVAALSRAGAAARLREGTGMGAFHWVMRRVGPGRA